LPEAGGGGNLAARFVFPPAKDAAMSDSETPRGNTASRASLRLTSLKHSAEKQTRKAAIFHEMETARTIGDAKTAKLRAQRLARDEAERPTPAKTQKKR
jgi:hypothetical protein